MAEARACAGCANSAACRAGVAARSASPQPGAIAAYVPKSSWCLAGHDRPPGRRPRHSRLLRRLPAAVEMKRPHESAESKPPHKVARS